MTYIYMIANTPLAKGWCTVVYLWCRGLDRTTPRSAPWIVRGYCNFTVFLLPTNFIVNFAEHPVTQDGFITYTHTPVQPLPQLHENRLKKRKENVARQVPVTSFFPFFFVLPVTKECFVPVFPKTFFFPCSLRHFAFVPLFPS